MKLKKSFGILILLFLLIDFFTPGIVFSVPSTTLCCKITRSFKYKGETFNSGTCIGEVGGGIHCYRPDGKRLCTSITAKDNWGTICLFNAIYGITDIVFNILLAIAILFGLGGGYLILTAGGEPEKINRGKNLIVYAILGVVASFFARIIPSLLSIILG